MKILMLNYEFPPVGGGGGVAAYKLALGFIQLGHEVDYVTTWYKGLKKFEVVNGINVYRIKVPMRKELATATIPSMVTFPFLAYPLCVRLFKRRKYDFINTQFAIPTGPLGVWLSRKFKKKNILSVHGGDLYDPSKKTSPHRNWLLRKVVRWVFNNSTIAVAQSSDTKKNALRFYNPNKKVNIIPLPYENIKFKSATRKQLKLDLKKKYLISVGRLVKRKGYLYLVKALSLLKDKSIEVIILGEGPEKSLLESLAKRRGVFNRIHFPGFVSEEKKMQLLHNSNMYVLSSLHEGFGIVLQEAMQAGLPIVATNHGGQIDLIKDSINGLLVPPKNEVALAEAIEKVFDDKLTKRMNVNNLKKVKEFSFKSISTKYLKLLI